MIRGGNASRIGSSPGKGPELVGTLRPIHALRTDDLEVSAAEPVKVNDTVDGTNRILILAGSLRRDSYNRALGRAAAQLAPSGVSTATFDGLGALPFYDGDVEDEGLPATVVALRRAIVEADALLIATPEYNGATSGVLKNALDWASRGPARILAGKPVAVDGRVHRREWCERRYRVGRADHEAARVRTCSTMSSPFRLRPERSTTTWPCATPEVRAEVAELVTELADRARGNIALAA